MTRPPNPTSLDAAIDALSDVHRRRTLVAVSDRNPGTEDESTPDTLAPAEPADDDPARLKAELHHVHLPGLAERGCIDWNAGAQTARRGANVEEIAPPLRPMNDHRDGLPEGWL